MVGVESKGGMRRQLQAVFIVAWLGFAASPALGASSSSANVEVLEAAPVTVETLPPESSRLRDEAAMLIVGTALIGLAAAVRRAG